MSALRTHEPFLEWMHRLGATPAGVAIMLGAEIGTCSDTLLATIGRGRPALRTGSRALTSDCKIVTLAALRK